MSWVYLVLGILGLLAIVFFAVSFFLPIHQQVEPIDGRSGNTNPELPTTVSPTIPRPTETAPPETITGIPEIDRLIITLLSNDRENRLTLVRFVDGNCTSVDGLGRVPRCAAGQVEGTAVSYLPLGGPGEGGSVLAEDVASVLDFDVDALYAAYVVADDVKDEPEYPHGKFALYFTFADAEGEAVSVVFRVNEEGYIVRLDNLGLFPVDMHFQQKAADVLDNPPENEMFASEASGILVYPPDLEPVEKPLPDSLKGYTIVSEFVDGRWSFYMEPGRNAEEPCAGERPDFPGDVPGYTEFDIRVLKEMLDQVASGEYVTLCTFGVPDFMVLQEITGYSEERDIALSVFFDVAPSPTVVPPTMPKPES